MCCWRDVKRRIVSKHILGFSSKTMTRGIHNEGWYYFGAVIAVCELGECLFLELV